MFNFTYKYRMCRPLRSSLSSTGGRNFTGRLSLLHRAGPKFHWNYCYLDNRRVFCSSHVIIRFDFNSFRNCYLMLTYDFQFGLSYHRTVSGLRISRVIRDNKPGWFGLGSSVLLRFLSPGQVISNVRFDKFVECKFGRSSGSKIIIVSSNLAGQIVCKLPSGLTKQFGRSSSGLLGPVAINQYKSSQSLRKAGFWVSRGRRPVVRGVAKNPVDHPHGGGEGKKSPPVAPRSPWGWLTLLFYLKFIISVFK